VRPGRHGKRFRPGDPKKPCRPLTDREILVTDRGKKIDRQIAISLSCYPYRLFHVSGLSRKLFFYFSVGVFNFSVGLVTLREIRFSSSGRARVVAEKDLGVIYVKLKQIL